MILKFTILIAYASLISFISISKSDPSIDGFTTDLIHRDSPQSPTYDPSLSPTQRIANAIRRSSNRIQRFNDIRSQRSPESNIFNSHGFYLMKYSIGTPPVPTLGNADTGSDIIWTQCKPCIKKCFNQTLPLFDPKKSSTYKTIPCNTTRCSSLAGTSCSPTRRNCLFDASYGYFAYTNGLLASDTITLFSASNKKVVSLPNITFGCAFEHGGAFESGIVGLGAGSVSLVQQLGPLAQGKLSYCLVPWSSGESSPSKLNFGAKAVVSGNGVVSTPLVRKEQYTYYLLTLEGISVGNKRLDYYDEARSMDRARVEGNFVIDSGTAVTFIPTNLYEKVENELNRSIALNRTKDHVDFFRLCYATMRDDIEHPPVTFHFTGADVKLKTENIFLRTSNVSLCFVGKPTVGFGTEGFGVYGNVMQINYLVGYDLEKMAVSFRPAQCVAK